MRPAYHGKSSREPSHKQTARIRKAILGAVGEAKSRANLVLFSIHTHETAGDDDEPPPLPFEPMVLRRADEAPSPNDPRPAGFEVNLFHPAVDHGADLVIRRGVVYLKSHTSDNAKKAYG